MRTFRFLCFVVLLLPFAATAQDSPTPKRGPSTPEERKRFVEIVHKVEKAPLDSSLNKDVKWALDWVNDVPDVNVELCFAPLDEALHSNYKYRAKIAGEFALASAAFLVEHPDKVNDKVAQYMAGVEGSLRVYQAILKSEPEAKSDELSDLVQKQKDGKLEEYVRKAAKDCQQAEKQS